MHARSTHNLNRALLRNPRFASGNADVCGRHCSRSALPKRQRMDTWPLSGLDALAANQILVILARADDAPLVTFHEHVGRPAAAIVV